MIIGYFRHAVQFLRNILTVVGSHCKDQNDSLIYIKFELVRFLGNSRILHTVCAWRKIFAQTEISTAQI